MTNVTKNEKKRPMLKGMRWLKSEVTRQDLADGLYKGATRLTPRSIEADRNDE
jgi:hypothetical protein